MEYDYQDYTLGEHASGLDDAHLYFEYLEGTDLITLHSPITVGSNAGTETLTFRQDREQATDLLMRPEDVTIFIPGDHAAAVPQVAIERTSDLLPVAVQEDIPEDPQHELNQVRTDTRGAELEAYIIKSNNDNDRKTSFQCGYPACSYPSRFDTKKQVIFHIRRAHLEGKFFKCATCEAFFAYKQDVRRHYDSIHRGIIHRCAVCEQGFTRAYSRNKHQKRCTKNKE